MGFVIKIQKRVRTKKQIFEKFVHHIWPIFFFISTLRTKAFYRKIDRSKQKKLLQVLESKKLKNSLPVIHIFTDANPARQNIIVP